jgi:predicted nucleotidyltransferase
MTDEAILAEAVRRIEAQCHPRQVLLFGSRARGDSRAASDFDLAVVVDDLEDKWAVEADLYGVLFDLPAAFDVIAFDAAEWGRWSQVPVAFEHRIWRDGRVLAQARA